MAAHQDDQHEHHHDHHEHDHHHGHGHHGHDHAGHSPEAFRKKFWLSLALTLPIVFWAEHVQMLLGYQAPTFPGSDWIGPVVGTVLFMYGGWVFLPGAVDVR